MDGGHRAHGVGRGGLGGQGQTGWTERTGRQAGDVGVAPRRVLTLRPSQVQRLACASPAETETRPWSSSPPRTAGPAPQCRTVRAGGTGPFLTAPFSSVQTGILIFLETASSGVLKTETCPQSELATGRTRAAVQGACGVASDPASPGRQKPALRAWPPRGMDTPRPWSGPWFLCGLRDALS